jgi:excisionase family DNA binding protein
MVVVMTDIHEFFSLSLNEFCRRTGVGRTLAREMIDDGRLRAIRAGKRKLLVDVASWVEHVARQQAAGVPEYTATANAVKARKAAADKARRKAEAKGEIDLEGLGLT